MKSLTFLLSFLLFCNVAVFSQDSLPNKSYINLSGCVLIPINYNVKFEQPITYEIFPGYNFYNKMGSSFRVEYLKKIKSNFFIKAGFDLTTTSLLITAKGNEAFIFSHNHLPVFTYERKRFGIISGIIIGAEYRLCTRSQLFLNITPDLLRLYIERILSTDNSKATVITFRANNIRFKLGYSFLFYKGCRVFITSYISSDDFTVPYFGIGLSYTFKN